MWMDCLPMPRVPETIIARSHVTNSFMVVNIALSQFVRTEDVISAFHNPNILLFCSTEISQSTWMKAHIQRSLWHILWWWRVERRQESFRHSSSYSLFWLPCISSRLMVYILNKTYKSRKRARAGRGPRTIALNQHLQWRLWTTIWMKTATPTVLPESISGRFSVTCRSLGFSHLDMADCQNRSITLLLQVFRFNFSFDAADDAFSTTEYRNKHRGLCRPSIAYARKQ